MLLCVRVHVVLHSVLAAHLQGFSRVCVFRWLPCTLRKYTCFTYSLRSRHAAQRDETARTQPRRDTRGYYCVRLHSLCMRDALAVVCAWEYARPTRPCAHAWPGAFE